MPVRSAIATALLLLALARVGAAALTYAPYIQPGDSGPVGAGEQMVLAWQTDEARPHPERYQVSFGADSATLERSAPVSAREVDQYLEADPQLPVPPGAYGAHADYTSVLRGLAPDAVYRYRVSGPGLPPQGFSARFRTRRTGTHFSFVVLGDEGYFQPDPAAPPRVTNYFGRMVHLLFHAGDLTLPGEPARPGADFAIVTGDNVYNTGAEDSYRDFWMPVWNSDQDSIDHGAPFVRSIPTYIVVGNHDIGGNGDRVELLATSGAGPYAGQTGGGDALAYYNNYYFPLNGPSGVDPFVIWDGGSSSATGFTFSYEGKHYESAAAAEALRATTRVDSGHGAHRQIDHMSNYSFDEGNAHFVFLDSNPHLFGAQVDATAIDAKPLVGFADYPQPLTAWLLDDLDGSTQTWKIVVYHHAPFSSGNATARNFQMRKLARLLEAHGVNLVLSGHEHNYQRTRPLRATSAVAEAPRAGGPELVDIDTRFDGDRVRVPDGVLYIVEGAGGNRDFDGDEPGPRGLGAGVDQDDSAGRRTADRRGAPSGPLSWLDTRLTSSGMRRYLPGAGEGPKITVRFKAKVFSFGQVVVAGERLTLWQISEPLGSASSASPARPVPFGTNARGQAVRDPLPATQIDPRTRQIVGLAGGPGAPDLLDRWTIEKPDLARWMHVRRQAEGSGERLTIENESRYALNGAQLDVGLASADCYVGPRDERHRPLGSRVIVTLGRIASGGSSSTLLPLTHETRCRALSVQLRSATAQPVMMTLTGGAPPATGGAPRPNN